jgi:hypothetical protein
MDRKKEREKPSDASVTAVKCLPFQREDIPQRPSKRPWIPTKKQPNLKDKALGPTVIEKPLQGFDTKSVNLLKDYERDWRVSFRFRDTNLVLAYEYLPLLHSR